MNRRTMVILLGSLSLLFNVFGVCYAESLTWKVNLSLTGLDITPFHMINTSDGGSFFSAKVNHPDGTVDAAVIKLSKYGDMQWNATLAGTTGSNSIITVVELLGGGYAAVAITNMWGAGGYDIVVMKFNAGGGTPLIQVIGTSANEDPYYLAPTPDGGLLIVGNTDYRGSSDALLIKVNSSLSVTWSRTLGKPNQGCAWGAIAVADGFVIVGEYNQGEVWVFKLDFNGNIIWNNVYRGAEIADVFGQCVVQANDGSLVVTTAPRPCILRLDPEFGDVIDAKKIEGLVAGDHAMASTDDGGIVLASTDSQQYCQVIAKLNSQFGLQWSRTYPYGSYGSCAFINKAILQHPDGGYVLPTDDCNGSDRRIDILRLDLDGLMGSDCDLPGASSMTVQSLAGVIVKTSLVLNAQPIILTNTPVAPSAGPMPYNQVICYGNLFVEASANPPTGQTTTQFQFASTIKGGVAPYTYFWEFGDGFSSTASNPNHRYSTAGVYHATVTVQDNASHIIKSEVVSVIVFPAVNTMLIDPNQGTTAGGTWIDLYANYTAFYSGFSAWFSFANSCSDSSMFEAGATVFISGNHIQIKTPAASGEIAVALKIDNPTQSDICRVSYFNFTTLAHTANQGTTGPRSQSVSILDTAANGLFGPKGSMSVAPAVVPMNMAYNRASTDFTAPGRILYMVDYASGNLESYDASNFSRMGMTQLQDPAAAMTAPRACDLALSRDGRTMFVSHVTSGAAGPNPINPGPGGVSVLTLDAYGVPSLYDVDQNSDPETTSAGAPAGSGMTRLRLKSGEGEYAYIYPLSIQSVSITDGISPYTYRDGEPFPGEYLFVSGVSEARCAWNCTCAPGRICGFPIFEPRPALVAILDNNPSLYCDLKVHPEHCLDPNAYYNPRYWKNRTDHNAYKAMGAGADGINLGDTSNALGFSLTSGTPPTGSPALGPTVYMLNQSEGQAYLFNYTQATGDWSVVMDPINPTEPYMIATGPNPTDVKVQSIDPYTKYAYITNAGDDTVRIINTANNTRVLDPDPLLKSSSYTNILHPTSFDTRSTGERGYSSNFDDGTVSVFNLTGNAFQGMIDVGEAPIRIVVQPVPGGDNFFAAVRNELAFAQPTDFTTPPKQSNLIRDWEDVYQLQETSADSQAVLANINAFQTKVNNWVTSTTLKKIVNEGVNLYRSAYIHDHPTARQ